MKFFMETLSWKRPRGTNRLIFQVKKNQGLPSVPMPRSRTAGWTVGQAENSSPGLLPRPLAQGSKPQKEPVHSLGILHSEPLVWGTVHEHRHTSHSDAASTPVPVEFGPREMVAGDAGGGGA